MEGRPVDIRIAGQTYKVISTAQEDELHRLADAVTAKIEALTGPARRASPHALVLVAIGLARELEQERAYRLDVERRTKAMLERVLGRIDDALNTTTDP